MSDQAIAARALYATGKFTLEEIGSLLGVSKSTVQRWVSAEPVDAPEHSAVDDLEALLSTQELDDVGRMNAGIARQLASKLDTAAGSDKAQDSMAVPALAKELRSVVDAIMGASTDDREWLSDVFSAVGYAQHSGTKDTGPASGEDRG